ncbi:MAG: ATP-binding protein [Candidatus Omnitrophota bacterium]
MIISIASGKGGTGKTTVAVNLALSLERVRFIDCDVEEPNAHLFLKPVITTREPVYISVPKVNRELCDYCGICAEVCAYNVIAVIPQVAPLFFEHMCHGCGACTLLCPRKAIYEVQKEIGHLEKGACGGLDFCSGTLDVGQAMVVPLIKQALKFAAAGNETVIIDAPPGTACSMVAAVSKSDFCVLVTEPTPFGLNDLQLAIAVLKEVKVPFGVVINRSDLGDDKVEAYCRESNIPVLMRLPFDREIATCCANGTAFIHEKKEYVALFLEMFASIERLVAQNAAS